MRRVVTDRLDDGGQTLLRDRQEGVRGSGGLDGVHSDVDRAVLPLALAHCLERKRGLRTPAGLCTRIKAGDTHGTVLESNRH